jgi:hypothetical protein
MPLKHSSSSEIVHGKRQEGAIVGKDLLTPYRLSQIKTNFGTYAKKIEAFLMEG